VKAIAEHMMHICALAADSGERLNCLICRLYHGGEMPFPIKVCVICSEEFELKPDKPGFANRCPECSASEEVDPTTKRRMDADERKIMVEANEARRRAIRDLLYRKEG
jgi:hypothetical protein